MGEYFSLPHHSISTSITSSLAEVPSWVQEKRLIEVSIIRKYSSSSKLFNICLNPQGDEHEIVATFFLYLLLLASSTTTQGCLASGLDRRDRLQLKGVLRPGYYFLFYSP